MIKFMNMNMTGMKILISAVLIVFSFSLALGQESRFYNKLDSSRKVERTTSAQLIFNDIEAAIASGKVGLLSKFFGSQTYFSLSSGTSGYYSSNQAYYLLEDFFKIYQVTAFRFKNVNAVGDSPYATGVYSYDFKGQKSTAQVYVSLKYFGSNWKITQITIN